MKLIDLLVQELPHRGGWPNGVDAVEMDCEGELFERDSDYCSGFKLEKCDDWITDVVTKQQYDAALESSEGWIDWHGGECPVDSDAIVEVRFRNQNQNHYQYNNDRAGDFEWEHIGSKCDIIAYRLHKPDINSRANDDRLEQDLNECIGQDVDVPEWHGDGVPPVGIECEVKWTGGKWEKCEVIFVGTEKVVVEMRNREAAMSLCDVKFRPLRTEAEKAMESAKHIIADLCRDSASNGHSADLIMEAIAAGKIPGVKLEDK